MRVLLVDDDAVDRSLFKDAVAEINRSIECIELTNGEQVLQYLNHQDIVLPDCIFLDLRMPRINGKNCLTEIKKDSRLSHIPIYIYTTSRDHKEAKELKEAGAFHFISKPDDTEDIYYLLAVALEEQERLIIFRDQN